MLRILQFLFMIFTSVPAVLVTAPFYVMMVLPSQLGPRKGQLQAEMESSYCRTAIATGQGKMCSVNFSIHLSQ